MLVGGSQDASALSSRLRTAMRQIDPALAADQVRTLDDWLDETIATPRLTSLVAAAFAVIAVLLATVGIYGVVAYTVGLRTPEIGLRMAMGATPRNVLALVLRGGLMAAVLGTIPGAGGALLAGRVLRTMLFEVDANDPATFAAAALLLLGVSLAACYMPARRASRVDPLLALRSQ